MRYADNYLLACQSVTEGRESIARLTDLLQPAGFTLKPSSVDITDLRRSGARTTVLGLELRLEEDGVIVGVGSGAIESLRDALELAHLKPDPMAVANAAAWGWFGAAGPALGDVERRDRLVRMVLREMDTRGHCEVNEKALLDAAEGAWNTWVALCERMVAAGEMA